VLFGVLGPLEVRDGRDAIDLGAGKPVTMLSALLLNANAWVSLEQLIAVTWQQTAAPASAARNISTYVWQMRRLLGADRIEGRRGAYRMRIEPGELDAHQLEEHAAAAQRARSAGDVDGELAHLEAAGRLWRGTPYQELVADPEASLEADRLRELYLTVRTDQAEALVRAGRPAQAAVLLREVTARDPLREHAWALLVRSLHHAGRRGEAEATYRRARSTLLAELGVEPGPELAAAREVSAEPDPYELAAASGVDVASVKRVLACLQRHVHGPSAWQVA